MDISSEDIPSKIIIINKKLQTVSDELTNETLFGEDNHNEASSANNSVMEELEKETTPNPEGNFDVSSMIQMSAQMDSPEAQSGVLPFVNDNDLPNSTLCLANESSAGELSLVMEGKTNTHVSSDICATVQVSTLIDSSSDCNVNDNESPLLQLTNKSSTDVLTTVQVSTPDSSLAHREGVSLLNDNDLRNAILLLKNKFSTDELPLANEVKTNATNPDLNSDACAMDQESVLLESPEAEWAEVSLLDDLQNDMRLTDIMTDKICQDVFILGDISDDEESLSPANSAKDNIPNAACQLSSNLPVDANVKRVQNKKVPNKKLPVPMDVASLSPTISAKNDIPNAACKLSCNLLVDANVNRLPNEKVQNKKLPMPMDVVSIRDDIVEKRDDVVDIRENVDVRDDVVNIRDDIVEKCDDVVDKHDDVVEVRKGVVDVREDGDVRTDVVDVRKEVVDIRKDVVDVHKDVVDVRDNVDVRDDDINTHVDIVDIRKDVGDIHDEAVVDVSDDSASSSSELIWLDEEKGNVQLQAYICTECYSLFGRRKELEEHALIHQYDCGICSERFSTKKDAKRCFYLHLGCTEEYQQALLARYASSPVKNTESKRPGSATMLRYVCPVCIDSGVRQPWRALRSTELKRHARLVHGADLPDLRCNDKNYDPLTTRVLIAGTGIDYKLKRNAAPSNNDGGNKEKNLNREHLLNLIQASKLALSPPTDTLAKKKNTKRIGVSNSVHDSGARFRGGDEIDKMKSGRVPKRSKIIDKHTVANKAELSKVDSHSNVSDVKPTSHKTKKAFVTSTSRGQQQQKRVICSKLVNARIMSSKIKRANKLCIPKECRTLPIRASKQLDKEKGLTDKRKGSTTSIKSHATERLSCPVCIDLGQSLRISAPSGAELRRHALKVHNVDFPDNIEIASFDPATVRMIMADTGKVYKRKNLSPDTTCVKPTESKGTTGYWGKFLCPTKSEMMSDSATGTENTSSRKLDESLREGDKSRNVKVDSNIKKKMGNRYGPNKSLKNVSALPESCKADEKLNLTAEISLDVLSPVVIGAAAVLRDTSRSATTDNKYCATKNIKRLSFDKLCISESNPLEVQGKGNKNVEGNKAKSHQQFKDISMRSKGERTRGMKRKMSDIRQQEDTTSLIRDDDVSRSDRSSGAMSKRRKTDGLVNRDCEVSIFRDLDKEVRRSMDLKGIKTKETESCNDRDKKNKAFNKFEQEEKRTTRAKYTSTIGSNGGAIDNKISSLSSKHPLSIRSKESSRAKSSLTTSVVGESQSLGNQRRIERGLRDRLSESLARRTGPWVPGEVYRDVLLQFPVSETVVMGRELMEVGQRFSEVAEYITNEAERREAAGQDPVQAYRSVCRELLTGFY